MFSVVIPVDDVLNNEMRHWLQTVLSLHGFISLWFFSSVLSYFMLDANHGIVDDFMLFRRIMAILVMAKSVTK